MVKSIILSLVLLSSPAMAWESLITKDGNYRSYTITEQDELFAIDFMKGNCDTYILSVSTPNTNKLTPKYLINATIIRIGINGEFWRSAADLNVTNERVWILSKVLTDINLMKALLGGSSASVMSDSPYSKDTSSSLVSLVGAKAVISNSYFSCSGKTTTF